MIRREAADSSQTGWKWRRENELTGPERFSWAHGALVTCSLLLKSCGTTSTAIIIMKTAAWSREEMREGEAGVAGIQ